MVAEGPMTSSSPRHFPYPEACSPGSGGPDFGRFSSVPDVASPLPTSSLEDLLCSHAPLSSEDEASPGCVTSSQLPFRSFLSPPELLTRSDRKLSPLLSPLQDPLADKAPLEPREMLQPKKRSRASQAQRGTAASLGRSPSSWTGASWPTSSQVDPALWLHRVVSNIPEKIKQTSIKSLDGSVDEKKLCELTHRYLTLTAWLEKLGYRCEVHPVFTEFLINTYGILKQRPDLRANPLHSSLAVLRKLVIDIVPPKFLGDSLLLLNCLCELAKEDSKPLFAWLNRKL
ncbi:speriolin-like protein [Heterocephalus glaber]|uniref:Speriolin-like protein n=1 Tax=Heterocephalus glaber TaxID=10181 RepID=A0AAX6SWD9_HETGA|nr:speriolin-like protein [Heterocephalus glaber]